jgi:hypothetical protein
MFGLVIAQYAITAISSAFNASYFMRYRSSEARRRIGSKVLAILSLAIFAESIYFGLFALFQGRSWGYDFFLQPGHWFMARLLLCIASVVITVLILRQLRKR